jgi:hypothetical protein
VEGIFMKKMILYFICVSAFIANASFLVYDSQGFENFELGSAHGQTGVYHLHSGATSNGAFEVKTGNTDTAMTIVDIGGERGNVLSINNDAGGWTTSFLQIGWQGNASSGWAYEGKTQYMHITFDFYDNGVSGALSTWRANNATIQGKVWLQSDTMMECRKDSTSASQWPPYDVEPDYTLNQWHTFQLTTMWDDATTTYPIFTAYIDGVELNVAGEDNTWYSTWAGYTGWFDAMSFNYLVNQDSPMLIDNITMVYSDSAVVPEPATILLMSLGGAISVIRRKHRK